MVQPYGEGRSLQGILDGSWTGDVFCNRLRLSDWIGLFSRYGFETLVVEPVITLKPEYVRRESFAEPFRSKSDEDLAALAVRIVGRSQRL